MEALRFGWIGPDRLEACRTHVSAILVQWQSEWCGTQSRCTVETVDDKTECDAWRCVSGASTRVFLGFDSRGLDTLAHRLLELEPGAADRQFAVDIAERAVINLGERLVGSLSLGGATNTPPASHDTDPRFGGAIFLVRTALGEIRIVAPGGLCSRIAAPVSQGPLRALSTRSSAVTGCATQLKVELALGSIDIRNIASLQVGELLVFEQTLSAPVKLRTVSGAPVADAVLTALSDKRAVRLTSTFNDGNRIR